MQLLLGVVDEAVGAVDGFDLLLVLLVLRGELLGFLHALLDLLLAEVGGSGDGDLLLVAGGKILRRDIDDAVAVDVEGNFDLRHAARRRSDAGQLEAAEGLVVGGHLALALQYVHLHAGLAVGGRGEDLRLFVVGMVVLRSIKLGEHAAHGLDAQ